MGRELVYEGKIFISSVVLAFTAVAPTATRMKDLTMKQPSTWALQHAGTQSARVGFARVSGSTFGARSPTFARMKL
jgi:hypothetical protein